MAEVSNERTELEFQLLGAMIHDREVAGRLLAVLTREDFSYESLQTVFDAVRKLFNTDAPIDKLTVLQLTGDDYGQIVDKALSLRVMPGNADYYAAMLRDRARLEAINEAALELSLLKESDPESINRAVAKINALNVTKRQWRGLTMQDALNDFFDRHAAKTKPEYLDFGFRQLNKKLYCEPGDLVILAGEPSSGKTALAAQMAFSLAEKHRVGFFTLETSPSKLTDRMISRLARIPMPKIKEHNLTEADWNALYAVAEKVSAVQIDQIPASGMTVQDIRSYSLAHRYDVIFIDYLQIIRPENTRLGRYEQVTQISMALHTFAQETHTAVIALAQLNRPDRGNKNGDRKPVPPNMHDVKESGQIEQDADAILLLYNKDPNSYTGNRFLKIGKNKEGERELMELAFDGGIQSFSEDLPAETEKARRRPYKENEDGGQEYTQASFEELEEKEPLPF